MNTLPDNEDYLMTLYEVCETLGKSTRTVSRYIRRHILHPRGVKSKQGTLEYRFSKAEVEEFKKQTDETQISFFEQGSGLTRVPIASFASLDCQTPVMPPRQQIPFIIPGVSLPTAAPIARESQNINSIPSPRPDYQKNIQPETQVFNEYKNVAQEKKEPVLKNENPPVADIEKKPDQSRGSDEEIIILLRETTGMLRDQLKVKDDQIKNLDDKIGQLIERNRETNILLKGLQDKMVLLEKPKTESHDQNRTEQARSQKPTEHGDIPVPPSRATSEDGSTQSNPVSPIKIKIVNESSENLLDRGARNYSNPSKQTEEYFNGENYPRNNEEEAKPINQKKGFFGKMFS